MLTSCTEKDRNTMMIVKG